MGLADGSEHLITALPPRSAAVMESTAPQQPIQWYAVNDHWSLALTQAPRGRLYLRYRVKRPGLAQPLTLRWSADQRDVVGDDQRIVIHPTNGLSKNILAADNWQITQIQQDDVDNDFIAGSLLLIPPLLTGPESLRIWWPQSDPTAASVAWWWRPSWRRVPLVTPTDLVP